MENEIEKICTVCGILKSLDEYHNQKKGKHGKRSRCKMCASLESKKYRKNNKEKTKEHRDRWQKKNKEKVRAYQKVYQKTYKETNQEKIADYAKNYNAVYNKKRFKEDPEYRLKINISNLFIMSFKLKGVMKERRGTAFYTGIQLTEYVEHFKKDPLWDVFCNNGDTEIDHIIPVSIFDYNNPKEIEQCWDLRNLRFITKLENILKRNKIDYALIEKYNIKDLLPDKLRIAI